MIETGNATIVCDKYDRQGDGRLFTASNDAGVDYRLLKIEYLDDMHQALRMEKETIERSIRYCREILGIKKDQND